MADENLVDEVVDTKVVTQSDAPAEGEDTPTLLTDSVKAEAPAKD